jgi:hypothetical protein
MGIPVHRNADIVWIYVIVIKQPENAGTGVSPTGKVLNAMVSL